MPSFFVPFLENFSSLFSDAPSVLCAQLGMLSVGILLVFIVLFTTRDVLLRIDSFLLQLLCVLLVAALPFLGFALYLLFRPSRTLAFQHLETKIDLLLRKVSHDLKNEQKPKQSPAPQKKK